MLYAMDAQRLCSKKWLPYGQLLMLHSPCFSGSSTRKTMDFSVLETILIKAGNISRARFHTQIVSEINSTVISPTLLSLLHFLGELWNPSTTL